MLLTGFLGIFWLASSIIASAADAPVQGRPDNGPPKNNVNAITQAAVKMGVLTCASRINQVTNFLSSGSENSAFLFLTKEAPDTHLFSASYEILKPDGTSGYASASFAPTQNPGGEAVYDVVEYKPVSRDELLKTVFKGLKVVGQLKQNVTMLDAGPVKIFLVPAGSGCIVIKKEIVR